MEGVIGGPCDGSGPRHRAGTRTDIGGEGRLRHARDRRSGGRFHSRGRRSDVGTARGGGCGRRREVRPSGSWCGGAGGDWVRAWAWACRRRSRAHHGAIGGDHSRSGPQTGGKSGRLRCSGVSNGQTRYLGPGMSLDGSETGAVIDDDRVVVSPDVHDRVAVPVDVVDDPGLGMEGNDFRAGRALLPGTAVTETTPSHVNIGIIGKTEAETDTNVVAMKGKTKRGAPGTMRRQGRPSTMGIAGAPRHPGGSPTGIRHPAPATSRSPAPSPVMERCPSPGVRRTPIPPAISPDPVAIITVGLPAGIDHRDGRLPNLAIFRIIDPLSVRREGIVKYLLGRRLCWRGHDIVGRRNGVVLH